MTKIKKTEKFKRLNEEQLDNNIRPIADRWSAGTH